MSTHMCKVVEVMLRSPCCHYSIRSRSFLHRATLIPVGSCGVPVGSCGVLIHPRRAYSLDSVSSAPGRALGSQQPRAEKTSLSSALAHRNLSAVALQNQPRLQHFHGFLDLGEIEENVRRAQYCKRSRLFIVDPELAQVVVEQLGPDLREEKSVIFECNPGPGVLTRTLLNAGAQKVVTLEGDRSFIPDLQELEGRLDGQLEVVHCDYFKLDPISPVEIKPPVMMADKLFTDLGISESSWTDDVPVRVIGVLPQYKERGMLMKMIYSLFERLSVYRYGRIELNLFISEKEYLKLMSRPGEMMNYRAFSALWQMACDIELLHKAPWKSFVKSSRENARSSKRTIPNDHLCLVRLRPRAELFSGGLTPSNASTMMIMVKQCLAKRKVKLIDRLNLWSPDSGSKLLLEMNMPKDILTGQVYPEEYLQLFQLMDKSQEFTHSWLYEEILENREREGWHK